MIYFDYSATTPTDKRVLKYFKSVSKKYYANPNSAHKPGKLAHEYVDRCKEGVLENLNIDDMDVVFTSGASEANNLAIKGIALKHKHLGNKIITTNFEHPSVTAPVSYLQKKGFEVEFVKCDKHGKVDLKDLEKKLNNEVILVSIGSVNSEIGILQPIEKIAKIVNHYSNTFFHCDITQSVGKVNLDYSDIDLLSLSAHKFYGIKGIGALIKNKDAKLETQIQGGSSTSNFRSGTPSTALIGSLLKALELASQNCEERYHETLKLRQYFVKKLKNIKLAALNSNDYCIPQIINISMINNPSKKTVNYLDSKDIYISSHTACSSDSDISLGIKALTNDDTMAKSSVRISISHLNNQKEVDKLLEALNELSLKKGDII